MFGFGDFVNNDEFWRLIVDNIEQCFDVYFDVENKVNCMNIVDNCIYVCVFFIQFIGYFFKFLDIEVMKCFYIKVNLILVIVKFDIFIDEEVVIFKVRVCFFFFGGVGYVLLICLQIFVDIKYYKVQIFEGFRYEFDDEEMIVENNEIMFKVFFVVVGVNIEVINVDGCKVCGCVYFWGVIEVDNEEYCDFVKFCQMFICIYMEEFKENINNMFYENY